MNSPNTISVLNRLLALHDKSLPMYLSYAAPYTLGSNPAYSEVLRHIVDDHKLMVDRIGSQILEEGGVVVHGRFPLLYTAWHDLSAEFLLEKLIECQKKDLAAIEACVGRLERSPAARALAEEAQGAAKGHLESLEELAAAPARA